MIHLTTDAVPPLRVEPSQVALPIASPEHLAAKAAWVAEALVTANCKLSPSDMEAQFGHLYESAFYRGAILGIERYAARHRERL